MSRTKIDYGIDLGTTNSAIVRMESGEPKIKKTDTLSDTMPSCLSFNKRKSIFAGEAAANSHKREKLAAMRKFEVHDSNTAIEFKRTMGTDKMYPISYMERDYSSEELSAEILKTLKSFVTDEDISSAIITVPAKFNTTQIDATQKSARMVISRIQFCIVLGEPIFEKCSHLREKGWMLIEIWQSRNRLSRTVPVEYQVEPFFITFCI